MKKIKPLIYPTLIIIFTLALLFPLLSDHLFYSDDAEFHAARVASYYLAAKQQQFPPRWAPNLNSGYGYPVFNFVYLLPYLVSTLVYIAMPISVVTSFNLSVIIFTISGGLGIYFLAKKFSLSSPQSLLAGTLYLTSPYTLINIYSRTAIGEIAFFAIIPWVMWSLESFIQNEKIKTFNSLMLIISLFLLLLTHQTSILATFPVLLIYYWLRTKNKQQAISVFKKLLPLIIISLMISSWAWLPALVEKKYVILDREDTISNYLTQFPRQLSFFFHKLKNLDRLNTFKMISLGYSSWIIWLSSTWINKNKKHKIIWYLLGTVLCTILLIMPFSRPLWLISGLGNYVQYPWRLLIILNLATVLLYLHLSASQLIKNKSWITSLLVISCLVSGLTYAQPRGFQKWSDYELFEYFKTTATFNEFQPIWAAEYTAYFPDEKISFRIPGKRLYQLKTNLYQPAEYANLTIEAWDGSSMTYQINTDEPVEVIQKTNYFPGWELVVNQQSHQILYQDEEFPGHIVYRLDSGLNQVELKFTNHTPARKIASYTTGIGIISTLGYLFILKIKKG